MSVKFFSLASGSSGNCYYLGNEEYGILIDAGIGPRTIKKRLRDKGVRMEQIMGLLITHDHTDHIKYAGVLGEKCGIPVFSTETIHNGMARNICMAEKIEASRRILTKETPFCLRDFCITAFEVPHDGSDNVGYYITWGTESFAIATDLGHIPSGVAHYMKQANYIVIEANYDAEMLRSGPYPAYLKTRITQERGHLCNDETAGFLSSIYHPGLTHIFLCHLSHENNHPELAYKTVAIKLQQNGISVGNHLTLVSLPRTSVSDVYALGDCSPKPQL
ncbi:MAG: MBL fold metallo-hydrolase [Bacteroidales bacterium]|nr:MBL fold metallo-hydrolase [Bacteroidales bacterium]